MKIFLAADHAGLEMKQQVADYLQRSNYEVVDEGDKQPNSEDDFPQFAGRAVNALLASGDDNNRAILICGSGQGMCMAANRFKGIRASVAWSLAEARTSRNDDDSNVLCLPARFLKNDEAEAIVHTWLNTPFAGASRYKRRLKQLDELT